MHPFTIRRAEASDDATLFHLGALAGERPVRRPALIGDVDGLPLAAISLADGRVVADPFWPAPGLETHLRLRRSGWHTRGGRAVREYGGGLIRLQ
jgi:hypothetical protein